jgi:hypothetical protein
MENFPPLTGGSEGGLRGRGISRRGGPGYGKLYGGAFCNVGRAYLPAELMAGRDTHPTKKDTGTEAGATKAGPVAGNTSPHLRYGALRQILNFHGGIKLS